MKYLYGDYTQEQIAETKKNIRGTIFFLLLCADPKTSNEYTDVNVNECFNGLLLKLGGMNELLSCPTEMVTIMSLLQAALIEYNNPSFNFKTYRKLILDAGAEVDRIKEV